MSRIDDALAVGNVVDFMNKNRAFIGQLIHNIAVMYDLAANIDGRTEGFKSDLHNIDRADDTGAEASRLEQQHPFLTWGSPGMVTVRDGFEGSRSHINSIPTVCIEGQD